MSYEIVLLYHIGSRMLLRYWKSCIVGCGKSYVVMKLKIDVGMRMLLRNWNRMFYDVGSRMLLRSW